MIDIGDEVTVNMGRHEIRGILKSSISTFKAGVLTEEYGVLIHGDLYITYFAEDLVKKATPLDVSDCDCGSTKAHYPNKPPGHAHWCKSTKWSWNV